MQWPPTKPGRKGRKFHLVPAAFNTALVFRPMRSKISASSFIALMNELALIFDRMGLNTNAMLKAAGTKWNFLPFRPGLVGGHCIGVDPYYLAHKAQAAGYYPEIILAGRRLNDSMGAYVVSQLVKSMLKKRIHIEGARILVMGLAFKENCPDLRN